MGRFNALILAALAICAGTSFAQAADMMSAPMMPEAPRLRSAPIPEFSGWYLRGDVGISADQTAKWDMVPGRLVGNGVNYFPTAYAPSRANVSSAVFVGLGVGYQFNNWFRADITGEYRGASRFSSNAELTFNDGAAAPNTAVTNLRTFNRGDLSSFVALANGYVDLGTWYGITPFVGAGIGIARNKISGMVDQGIFTTVTNGVTTTGTSGGFYGDGSKVNFAWALMAGLGYDVSSRLKLEIGYRYLNAGKATTGGLTCYGQNGCGNTYLVTKSNESHDIKVGMRWMLSDVSPAPSYEAPLVRKY